MNAFARRLLFAGASAVLAAGIVAGCTASDPRDSDEGAPLGAGATPTAPSTGPSSPNPSAAMPSDAPVTMPSAAPAGSIHVSLANATGDAVTIDVTDASATLLSAVSGTPGDGATVDAYKLKVANVSPTHLRLTWVGGPCDSANTLSIDALRRQFLLVQPECPGDAMATDRVLELTFSSAIGAAEVDAFLQDGLDTSS